MSITNQQESGYLNQVGIEIRHHSIDRDLLLRPLNTVLYLMPPYWIAPAQLTWVYHQIDRILTTVR